MQQAADLINVVRRRAAFTATNTALQNAAAATAMEITAAQVTLDFILDERTRELCGECTRWPDLAVRGKLVDRVKLYNTDGAAKVQAFHSLRPIPKSQLDAISDPNKTPYQNPGY